MSTIKGGKKLEAALKKIARQVSGGGRLQVGFMDGSDYPDGTSVAMVAGLNNFGAPRAGIPPRPFFSNMIAKESSDWPESLATVLKDNEYDGAKSLDIMGQKIGEQLQQSIIDTNVPALSPVTVMLRGMRKNDPSLKVTGKTVGEAAQRVADKKTNYGASEKPLVDQGIMLKAVTHKVEPF